MDPLPSFPYYQILVTGNPVRVIVQEVEPFSRFRGPVTASLTRGDEVL